MGEINHAPLVPPDVDLRDFPYMPVDITRLFGSAFHARATDAEWRAGVTLWLRSFHQVPAASLPQDDVTLARLAELGRDLKAWRKVKAMALHAWVLCRDGRLYHPVVAEKALEAWIVRLGQRKSSAAGNARRWGAERDAVELRHLNEQLALASDMLATLNPASRTLRRRSHRDPAGSPDEMPLGSQEKVSEAKVSEANVNPSQEGELGRGGRVSAQRGRAVHRHPGRQAMNKALRPHQERALTLLRQSLGSRKRRPMLQAPTGFGKTLLAAAVVDGARRKGKRVIFVVPALSLIDQTVQAFGEEGIVEVGVGFHELSDFNQPVQVASVQTLMRRKIPAADVVVIDEAHRWFDFYGKWMSDPEWAKVPFIGLSATPWTKGLGKHYDDLLIAATTRDLIDAGYLSQFRVFAPSHPDLGAVRTVRGTITKAT
jgi:hypothetical protein